MTARYDQALGQWAFEYAGIEFTFHGLSFNEAAFSWAQECMPVIRALDAPIHARVMECLGPCDKTKAEMIEVRLDDYGNSKTLEIFFAGDESWGDFGVEVVIADGKIVAAHGWD